VLLAIFSNKFVRVLTILLGVQAGFFYAASHGDAMRLKKPLADFPASIPGWNRVADAVVDEDTRSVLKADDVLSRFYARPIPDAAILTPAQREVAMMGAKELFIAYFSTQQQGQSPHSPKNCLPGAGWIQVDSGELQVPINGLPKPITINKYVIVKGSAQSLVLYWYQSHGRVVADEFAAKFFLVADSMRYHRSDTALVRVVAPVFNDDFAEALDSSTAFVQSVFPEIYRFLPM
jgi:EpsI family protein